MVARICRKRKWKFRHTFTLCLIFAVFLYIMFVKSGYTSNTVFRNVNVTGGDVTLPEVQHVVFFKTHKCASTTVMNILMRFGMSRNLKIMVPTKNRTVYSQTDILTPAMFLHYSANKLYDILCCHVRYDIAAVKPYFPADTRYIGIVRQPFKHFVSAFLYYRTKNRKRYLTQVQGENPVATFLENPWKYEPKSPRLSFTNNRMSFDFGYPINQFNNTSYMDVYLKKLESELDFVIIVEHFDESLLILKRMFGWKLQDILYIPRKFGEKDGSLTVTEDHEKQHRELAKLDYILYERFLHIFRQRLKEQDQSFYDELNTMRSVRQKVNNFCVDSKGKELTVMETQWNKAFHVTRRDCEYMLMTGPEIIFAVRNRYL